MSVAIANAPVSYGVFEMTVGSDRYLAPSEEVLEQVAAAGYAGIDLGPLGYLGGPGAIGDRLAERRLALSGGYIELPFHDPSALAAAMASLDQLIDTLDAARDVAGEDLPAARPTLAAALSSAHFEQPGRAQRDHTIGLDDAGWRRFGEGLARVVGRCRARGYEPAFHHHVGTLIEAPREVDRLLESSDVGLCLDTGHLLVGGGDPVAAVRRWAERIIHVHLKDASRTLMDEIIAERGTADQIWARGVFRALGNGDVDLDGVMEGLAAIGYGGWMVVEQDVLTDARTSYERAVVDQRTNRDFVAQRGW